MMNGGAAHGAAGAHAAARFEDLYVQAERLESELVAEKQSGRRLAESKESLYATAERMESELQAARPLQAPTKTPGTPRRGLKENLRA